MSSTVLVPLRDATGAHFVVASGATLVVATAVAEPRVATVPPVYTIDLCVGWVRVAECPLGEFAGVVRHRAQGEWRLSAPVNGVVFQDGATIEDVDTIRVVERRKLMFAGHVAPLDGGAGGCEITGTGDDGPRFVLSGPDAWEALASRIAYPTPSTEPPWADSHDERTGVASTVAAEFIDANLGSGALADRQLPDVTIVDGAVGATGTWTARLQRLDQLIARVCRDGGITCRVTATFDGGLRVWLGAARDRTSQLVLSEQGDLINIRRLRVPAGKSYVVAGGQGNLTARTFRTAGVATGAARKEAFADYSSLGSAPEVQQAADTTLARGAASWSISAELADTAAQRLVYLDDYDVGDLLAVEIDNVRHSVPVEAVSIVVTPTRQVIRPTLGEAAPDLLSGLLRDIAGLTDRFDNQIA